MKSRQISELIEELEKIRVSLERITNLLINQYQKEKQNETRPKEEYANYNDTTGGTLPQ